MSLPRLGWSVSAQHPLILISWSGRDAASATDDVALMRTEWGRLLPVVREHVALIFGCTDPHLEELAVAAERAGIPFFIQVRTWMPPHIPSYGNTSRGWQSETVSIGQVREWYRRYPGLVGVQAVELNCFGFSAEERDYIADLITVSAEVGGLVSWQEANDGCNLWLEVGMDRDLYRHIARHPGVLLPQWEMNVPKSMYLCHDSVMGLWLAGAVDNWGVEPQSWYWMEAGYTQLNRTPGEFDRGYREGDINTCPDTLWGQMVLLGASSGATVYSIEPFVGVVVNRERDGLADPWRRSLEPLFSWLITHRAIAARRQVLEKCRVAYYADFENPAFAERSDVDCYRDNRSDDQRADAHTPRGHGSGVLYAATYGLRHDHELIPNTGRYYWIPVLPKWASTDTLLAFPTVLTPNAFPGVLAARAFFDRSYPSPGDGAGAAWMVTVGGTAFVSQTHENLDVPEDFSLAGLACALRGSVQAHQYLVARDLPEGRLGLHLGNYRGRDTTVSLRAPGGQPLRVASAEDSLGGAAEIRGETRDGELVIVARHRGAIDLVVAPG